MVCGQLCQRNMDQKSGGDTDKAQLQRVTNKHLINSIIFW